MKKYLSLLLIMTSAIVLKAQFTPCPLAVVTYGSQNYNTVLIGTQCWFHENLNIGTSVADVTLQSNNSVIEKSCYNNSTADCTTYGGIYTWDEAMNYGTAPHGICPTGWHIPTQAEWQALIAYLGATTAGQQIKATSSDSPTWDGNNASGFLAIPGGIGQGTSFLFQGIRETYWSSTEFSSTDAYDYGLTTGINTLDETNNTKPSGYCIRCIQDLTTGVYVPEGNLNYFSLYPNPSTNNCDVAFSLSYDASVSLSVFNILGEEVVKITNDMTYASGEHKISVNTSEMVNGVYFVNLTMNGKSSIKKLIKLN
ncbi:MAG: FISUMP domain-containing protein [Bacteroidia bacterium]